MPRAGSVSVLLGQTPPTHQIISYFRIFGIGLDLKLAIQAHAGE